MTTFEELPPGETGLLSVRPGPDLAAAGYVEREYVARGTATSYAGHGPAQFATRVAVRRPVSPGSFSGTVVVEWLNVSSGSDTAPDWTYLSDEIVRRGPAWVGVSAQHIGVEGGVAVVAVAGVAPTGIRSRRRYAALSHPGDAYAYDMFTQAGRLARGGLLGPLKVRHVLATGEATWDEGLLLFLERSGFPEETYHTFSYSPLHQDDGSIAGMFCVVTEETDRVIGERRLALLQDLGARLALHDPSHQLVDGAVGDGVRQVVA